MEKETLLHQYITTSYGMRGYFAVLIGRFRTRMGCTFDEPIMTGVGSYDSKEEVELEAREWAASEQIELKL